MVTAVDTSVVVAALLAWHESHEPARDSLLAAMEGELVLPAPALAESYSVLTRLPSPHRVSPGDAHELLSGSFEERSKLVALTGKETWRFLDDVSNDGVAGGSTYDALILACAIKGGAERLLTLDLRDFLRFGSADIEIIAPGT